MGRLTQEIFNESCRDGGECSLQKASARPCGCDPGAKHRCQHHQHQYELDFVLDTLDLALSLAEDANCGVDDMEKAIEIVRGWK